MNIKQAAAISGISRENIRFYEKQGLLSPARDPENRYRDYSEADVRTLKLIRALRTVDLPLEDVRRVLRGELSLAEAAAGQAERLRAQAAQLDAAIRFCEELSAKDPQPATLDVDACLARMTAPGQKGWFTRWAEDYKAFAAVEHEKVFTFVPDEPVRNAREFTDALFAYANAQGLALTITKEGISPVFLLDGAEYRATRQTIPVRGVPVTTVRCELTHPELYDVPMSPARRRVMKLLHYGWPLLVFVFLGLSRYSGDPGFWLSPTGLYLIAFTAVLYGCQMIYHYYTLYNENGKRGKNR